jgi:hypothetical protein
MSAPLTTDQEAHQSPVRRGSGRTWLFLVCGALIGLAVGIVVSITTDVPFAPEVGLAIGLLGGWFIQRMTTRA